MPLLNESQRQQVIGYVSLGCSQVVAARMANCSLADVEETLKDDPTLLQELANSASHLEANALGAIEKAWDKNWRAACWLLERLYPERYARRTTSAASTHDLLAFLSSVSSLIYRHVRNAQEQENLFKSLRELGRELHARDAKPAK